MTILPEYRAVSILCCGQEEMHVEFRVRTLCELVLNENTYLHPSIVSHLCPDGIETSKNALVATSANFSRAVGKFATDVAQTVLRYDCIDTTKLGQYSNMWHIHGLASALGRPILSLYPETNDRIRPLLHKQINPRIPMDAEHQLPLIIFWTRTQPMVQGSKSWSPNHFVPCYDPIEVKASDANSIPSYHKGHFRRYSKYVNKPPHPGNVEHNLNADPADVCMPTTCTVISSPASDSTVTTLSCTPVSDPCLFSTQKAETNLASGRSSPMCKLLTEHHVTTPKSQNNQSHYQMSRADANPSHSTSMVISSPASESITLPYTPINDSNTSSNESLESQKADKNPISTSTIFNILNKVQDTQLPIGKQKPKRPSTSESCTLLKYANISNVQSNPRVSEKIVTPASTQNSKKKAKKRKKRQACFNPGSIIRTYVTSMPSSALSVVSIANANANLLGSKLKKGITSEDVVTQGSIKSNSVSHSASTCTVLPDPVAISSEHGYRIESQVSSVMVTDHSSEHTRHDTGAFQSEVSSVDLSCMDTQFSTSIASPKDETSKDVTSVKALFNLLDSGLITASKQKRRHVLGKAASQASITDWLDKSCNDTLNNDLSNTQELISPSEDILKRDTSIYDFPDADLSQVSHTTLAPDFCPSNCEFPVFHDTPSYNYSLTVDIPSTSDDDYFSETDLSGEDDHFCLKIETDSSDDDMDYDQCDDVYTHDIVELVNEKSSPLPFPNLSSQWYERQNKLATKNITRRKGRELHKTISTSLIVVKFREL